AALLERVEALAAAHHEEALELVAEERRAVLAAAGEVEGQRRERVDGAEAAHLLAVHGLDADDADDDLRRHAVDLFGKRQPLLVRAPEGHAGADARRLDEAA